MFARDLYAEECDDERVLDLVSAGLAENEQAIYSWLCSRAGFETVTGPLTLDLSAFDLEEETGLTAGEVEDAILRLLRRRLLLARPCPEQPGARIVEIVAPRTVHRIEAVYYERVTGAEVERLSEPTALGETAGFVCLFRASGGLYKIGSARNMLSCRRALEGIGGRLRVEIVDAVETSDAAALERLLHATFAEFRYKNGWYELDAAQVATVRAILDAVRAAGAELAKYTILPAEDQAAAAG